VLSPAALEAMRTPQVRAASYPAAGFAEWGGLGWAVRFIGGVKVVEHGGSLSGFQVKLKFVPAHRFAIAILTNSGRGGVLADRVAEWALDHTLGLRTPRPQTIGIPDDALARFAGRYRLAVDDMEEVAITVADGGLRCVMTEIDPATRSEETYPPDLLRPIAEREFVVVTEGENEGAQMDFIERGDGSIRFLRMGGRLYEPVADAADA
jgi:hypothetical protein